MKNEFQILLLLWAALAIFVAYSSSNQINGTISKNKRKRITPQNIDKEAEAINYGRTDYEKRIRINSVKKEEAKFNNSITSPSRPSTLCVTFMNTSIEQIIFLFSNVQVMKGYCDWAIVVYGEGSMSTQKLCDSKRIKSHVVSCKKASLLENKKASDLSAKNSSESIAKAVLYRELLSFLPLYKQVFLLDDDVSLVGFNPKKYFEIVSTAFGSNGPPLISQPLISDSDTMHNFLNYRYWHTKKSSNSLNDTIMEVYHRNRSTSGVLAAQVLLIEPLATLIDTTFFEWFVRRVLVHTKEISSRLSVDWGFNRLWCKAAQAFAESVLISRDADHLDMFRNVSAFVRVPCAVIVKGNPVRHANMMGLTIKHNRELFKYRAKMIFKRYATLFPNWMLMETSMDVDPTLSGAEKFGLKIVYNCSAVAIKDRTRIPQCL